MELDAGFLRSPYPGEPQYRRLARSLREEILEDRVAAGDRLPTESTLTQRLGLSRQTVRRAFLDLVSEGLVYRVPGRGTFVTAKSSRYRRQFSSVDDLMNLTLDTELEVVHPLSGMYDENAAGWLDLSSRSMYSVLFRRWHRGEVFCVTQVFLPAPVAAPLEKIPELTQVGHRSGVTVIGLLEARGVTIATAEQVATAVAASEDRAQVLGCEVGSPLLHVERLYIDDGGIPVEYAVSDFLPGHYSHRLRLGRGREPDTSRSP